MMSRFELSRETTGGNVRPMEGMRGFAVFLVFLVHYATLADPNGTLWISRALHSIGNTGVDLFFVLSGYLIYGSLISRRQNFLPYMGRRIQRIYPAFLAVFAAYVLLSFVFPAESKIPRDGAFLYLVQNLLLLPGIFAIEPMITVAWSLSYEMLCYLAMPVIVLLLRSRSTNVRMAVILAAAILIVAYCALFDGHIRLIMFLSGMLLYESVKRAAAPNGVVGALALVAGLLATFLPVPGPLQFVILFVAFYLFCLHCFVRPTELLARIFTWTPMRRLGNMSYSYYLLHGLALKAGVKLLSLEGRFFEMMPVMFIWTLIPSMVLFLLIERPLSLTSRKTTAQPADLAQTKLGTS